MIKVANWILTRRCNLSCHYCRIGKDYLAPPEYPPLSYFIKNEMPTAYIIEGLSRLHKNNPDMFHIFYGGEPLLRDDLPTIINFCNNRNIHYTIITNNSKEIQPRLDRLLNEVEFLSGITSSVDPIIYKQDAKDIHRVKKSKEGMARLKELTSIVKDVVAEVTVEQDTIHLLYPLIKELSDSGISSDITFADIAKSPYYDFSDIIDESVLLQPTEEVKEVFDKLIASDLDIHMKEELLPKLYDILPAKLDCNLFNNITIDADGYVRLCLRILGRLTQQLHLIQYFSPEGMTNTELGYRRIADKVEYCQGCNWTCPIIGNTSNINSLVHTDKRNED